MIVYTYFINPLLNGLKSGGIGHSANFNFKWNKINNYGQFLDKYSLQKSKMEYLSQLAEWIKPTTVTCNNDLETHLEAATMEDQFEAHIPEKKHKVAQFQHMFNPVLMVSANPEMIKGFRFEFGLPLSQYFTTSHSWSIPNSGSTQENPNPMMMPTQLKPTYSFTTQLVQDIRGQEPYTIMMGKGDNEGKIQAILLRKLHDNIALKVSGSFQSSNVEQGMVGAQLEIGNKDSMSVIKLNQGHWGYSLLQRIHPNLLVGFQYTNLTSQKLSFWSYGFKTFLKSHSLFANYVGFQRQYNLGYIIPIKKGTQFVAHYKYDAHEKAPTTILGFKQRYEQSDIVATINSQGELSTSVALKTPTFAIKLCALIDYMKDKYTFGYGITLGQGV